MATTNTTTAIIPALPAIATAAMIAVTVVHSTAMKPRICSTWTRKKLGMSCRTVSGRAENDSGESWPSPEGIMMAIMM